MSQVQVRQLPATSHQMMGAWFPSGYYGHFRAKSRADLATEFRQLARPAPPHKFLRRQNSEAITHSFSHHDNRFKFEGDPLVRCTQAGFGRRRTEGRGRGEFDPYFIGWLPENADRKRFIDDPKISSYADDYSGISTSSQILFDVQSIRSPTPSEGSSIYSSVYGHGQPDEQHAKQIHQETFQRFSTTKTRRSKLQRNARSFNVASCLVWNSTPDGDVERTSIDDKPKNSPIPPVIQSRNSFQSASSSFLPKLYHSQSMQVFERPSIDETGFTERQGFTPRPASSLEQVHTKSLQCLMSKYM